VQNGGQVNASSFGTGAAGSITVGASESIRVEGAGSGIVSRTGASGAGGDVALHAPRIEITSGGRVSAESTPGLLEVEAIFAAFRDDHLLRPPPLVATGDAGKIALEASWLVHLDAGAITTSVGVATGGNIAIDPVFVILERGSRIVAEAGTGHGGQIQIAADNFFGFPGSEVSAASGNPELSGTVEIHSPAVNLAGTLAVLPASFLDAALQMRERCAARRSGERAGSFAVRGPGGIPAEPDGWLPAPLLPDAEAATSAAPGRPVLVASLSGPLLAHAACP
jgi:large exoprotein involved in heme utilization and adhesion